MYGGELKTLAEGYRAPGSKHLNEHKVYRYVNGSRYDFANMALEDRPHLLLVIVAAKINIFIVDNRAILRLLTFSQMPSIFIPLLA